MDYLRKREARTDEIVMARLVRGAFNLNMANPVTDIIPGRFADMTVKPEEVVAREFEIKGTTHGTPIDIFDELAAREGVASYNKDSDVIILELADMAEPPQIRTKLVHLRFPQFTGDESSE